MHTLHISPPTLALFDFAPRIPREAARYVDVLSSHTLRGSSAKIDADFAGYYDFSLYLRES